MKTTIHAIIALAGIALLSLNATAQGTRLLRQPSLHNNQIAFEYGGDIWLTDTQNSKVLRLTSTAALESNPHFSPDGKLIAFSSNRSGITAVYTVSATGGTPTQLTWHPSSARVRGWSPDGSKILYASSRQTAPAGYDRLWTVSKDGGPSEMLFTQWGHDGSFSPAGDQMIVDRVSRWDSEWRAYRGGQNTPLILLDLTNLRETFIPSERTTDIEPLWLGGAIYFLSDRDMCSNIWSYQPLSGKLDQVTKYTGSDIKTMAGHGKTLIFERDGYLHLLDLATKTTTQLDITVAGDFPWAETEWQDLSKNVRAAALSPNAKRVIMEARGEIFTVPAEHGDARNITKSSGAADRSPIWSPKGNKIAWFSDDGNEGYSLMIADQDGMSEARKISIGASKMAWEPTWSPDGNLIAFVDDDVRVRVVDIKAGTIKTIDVGGTNLERGGMGLTWSPDSNWLAYSKSANNNFRGIKVWSVKDDTVNPLTNSFADAFSPAWDLDRQHLYFLASTDVALSSGWANTSAMTSKPEYAAYVLNLRKDDPSPFSPKSDEEEQTSPSEDSAKEKKEDNKKGKKNKKGDKSDEAEDDEKEEELVIDFENVERRTIALPVPERNYQHMVAGQKGSVFIAERPPNEWNWTLHKFVLEDRESKEFVSGARNVSVTPDGEKMLAQIGGSWKLIDTGGSDGKKGESLKVDLQMKLDRSQEWQQIFEEAWRQERDYFYDSNMHGRDWNVVHDRYAPLIPFVKHRADLSYILDQVNGELSVGHSFVFGGDFPELPKPKTGLLGADLIAENGRWKITRIYTTESWNPNLSSPLDRPGMKVESGNYLVGINGKELTSDQDPYEALDGTLDQQTVLHLNANPSFDGAWKETVKPIGSERALRQRAWVEDNRRKVDELSDGKLGYVWVPNTGGSGFVSFNRYFFAQQDKLGAVIDERFNGGGLLDDYMVDLINRSLRAAITNEVPNGKPLVLPAGILGPKVLLINEMAGSGGDFFPWVFRQQKSGPLIGARTWGGLVKSSVHYPLVDGGALTAPDNAVFDPVKKAWIGENVGIAPDIPVRQDAVSLSQGKDPQLERAVIEALKLLEKNPPIEVVTPPYPTPAKK